MTGVDLTLLAFVNPGFAPLAAAICGNR